MPDDEREPFRPQLPWQPSTEQERRYDRQRLINFVATYIRQLDRDQGPSQPGDAYRAVHEMEGAFDLFERRTVMRANRERVSDDDERPSGIPPVERHATIEKG